MKKSAFFNSIKLLTLTGVVPIMLSLSCRLPDNSPPSASILTNELTVTEQRTIAIENAKPISLSPDGKWLLVEQKNMPCIYDATSLVEQACGQWQGGNLTALNTGWSPDSKQVAFSENVQILFSESDIWVMETDTGNLTNHTDDGVFGSDWINSSDSKLDHSPTFLPNRDALSFFRTENEGDYRSTYLYTITGDNEPTKLAAIAKYPLSTYWRLFWSGDGEQIFYTLFRNDPNELQNGIWMTDKNGHNTNQLLGPSDKLGVPVLLSITPNAEWGIVVYSNLTYYGTQPSKDYLILLNIKSKRSETVILADYPKDNTILPVAATFSPDGSKILYIYITQSDQKTHLAIRDVNGNKEHLLLTQDTLLGVYQYITAELVWATNDTIFTNTPDNEGVLLQLGKSISSNQATSLKENQ